MLASPLTEKPQNRPTDGKRLTRASTRHTIAAILTQTKSV